jgi:hypothetical protein
MQRGVEGIEIRLPGRIPIAAESSHAAQFEIFLDGGVLLNFTAFPKR